MPVSKNPLGGHFQRAGGPNDDWFRNHVEQAQYTTTTVVDGSWLAADFQRSGVMYSISRDYGFEPEPKHIPEIDQVEQYAKTVYQRYVGDVEKSGNDSVHVYVNNEQGHQWQRIAMMRFMIEEAMKPGNKLIGMVFLNAAPGTIKTGNWGEPNEFASEEFMKLLIVMDKYRNVRLPSGAYAFILGVHDYTVYYAWCAVNGGIYSQDASWDTYNKFESGEYHVNWNLPQDHLGREYQGIRHALGWAWDDSRRKWITTPLTIRRPDNTPVEPPYIIVTECLFDNMDNSRSIHPHIQLDAGAERARGYHSLKSVWETNWFKEPAGRVLGKMMGFAWKHIFEPTSYHLGLNYFCFGESGGHRLYTVTLDGNPDMEYLNVVTPYRRALPNHMFSAKDEPMPPTDPPLPPVEPTPPPDDSPLWLRATLTPKSGFVNIRLKPSTASTIVNTLDRPYNGWIARDAAVTMTDGVWYPISINESDEKTWVPVSVLPLDGWARGDVFTFELITEEPPPVDPPPTPEYFIKVTEEQKAALTALLEQIVLIP